MKFPAATYALRIAAINQRWDMAQAKSTRPKVPEGKTRYLVTKQKEPNKAGFVGYDTNWEPMQKVAKYTTPKRP